MEEIRKIIHIDMDAFYASVEQRENPELKGKPVAVGGSSNRGVVAAASYEARKFGVFSAMPSKTALKKCPQLIFVKPNFKIYRQVSQQIREIFIDYTDLVEPLSLDEAFMDVTHNKKDLPSATLIAREIKKRIKDQTQLTASAGISINKFLAKVASDLNKPDGLTLIPPEKAQTFVEQLAIEKFFGVGKVTAAKMKSLGIHNGKDLYSWTEADLILKFGKAGRFYHSIARAIDTRPVEPERVRKSVSAENTFEEDLSDMEDLLREVKIIAQKLAHWIERNQTYGKTLTLKVKFSDFRQITRSKTVAYWISDFNQIMELAEELLKSCYSEDFEVRLLGLGISHLDTEENQSPQLTLDF